MRVKYDQLLRLNNPPRMSKNGDSLLTRLAGNQNLTEKYTLNNHTEEKRSERKSTAAEPVAHRSSCDRLVRRMALRAPMPVLKLAGLT